MQGKEHAAGLSVGNRFTWADWLLFAVLGLFCFLSFSQSDLLVTGNRSWMLYRSHITDFYDVVYDWEQAYYANYMPSTFLLFAVWILPLKLLGVRAPAYVEENRLILVMWYKLLPVAAYMLSGLLLYKIARRMGFSAGRAKACAFGFLTMPAAFFSQFIFSQYDSFTVLFMLLGIYFYMRRQRHDTLRFCLSFGVALTFKYWALLIFLVLLDRKKLTAILACSAVMAVPFFAGVPDLLGSGRVLSGRIRVPRAVLPSRRTLRPWGLSASFRSGWRCSRCRHFSAPMTQCPAGCCRISAASQGGNCKIKRNRALVSG